MKVKVPPLNMERLGGEFNNAAVTVAKQKDDPNKIIDTGATYELCDHCDNKAVFECDTCGIMYCAEHDAENHKGVLSHHIRRPVKKIGGCPHDKIGYCLVPPPADGTPSSTPHLHMNHEQHIKQATNAVFNTIDVDQNGIIDKTEFAQFMSGKQPAAPAYAESESVATEQATPPQESVPTPTAEELRDTIDITLSQDTQHSVKAALVRVQMESAVSEQTQESIRQAINHALPPIAPLTAPTLVASEPIFEAESSERLNAYCRTEHASKQCSNTPGPRQSAPSSVEPSVSLGPDSSRLDANHEIHYLDPSEEAAAPGALKPVQCWTSASATASSSAPTDSSREPSRSYAGSLAPSSASCLDEESKSEIPNDPCRHVQEAPEQPQITQPAADQITQPAADHVQVANSVEPVAEVALPVTEPVPELPATNTNEPTAEVIYEPVRSTSAVPSAVETPLAPAAEMVSAESVPMPMQAATPFMRDASLEEPAASVSRTASTASTASGDSAEDFEQMILSANKRKQEILLKSQSILSEASEQPDHGSLAPSLSGTPMPTVTPSVAHSNPPAADSMPVTDSSLSSAHSSSLSSAHSSSLECSLHSQPSTAAPQPKSPSSALHSQAVRVDLPVTAAPAVDSAPRCASPMQSRLDTLGTQTQTPQHPVAVEPTEDGPAPVVPPVRLNSAHAAPNMPVKREMECSPAVRARREMVAKMRQTLEWAEHPPQRDLNDQLQVERDVSQAEHHARIDVHKRTIENLQEGHENVFKIHESLNVLANSHQDANTMEMLHKSVSPCRSMSPSRLKAAASGLLSPTSEGMRQFDVQNGPWDKTDEAVMKAKKLAWMEVEIRKLNEVKQSLSDQVVSAQTEGNNWQQQFKHEQQFAQQLQKSLEEYKLQAQEHSAQQAALSAAERDRQLNEMSSKMQETEARLQSELSARKNLERRVAELEQSLAAENSARVAVENELGEARKSMEQFASRAVKNLEGCNNARQETLDTQALLTAAREELAQARQQNAALTQKSSLLESAVMAQQESAHKTLQAHAMLVSPDKKDNFGNLPVDNLSSWISQNCADARVQLAQQHAEHAQQMDAPSLDGNTLRQRVAERIKFQPNRADDTEPVAMETEVDNRLQQEIVHRLGLEAFRKMDEKKQEEVIIQKLGEELYKKSHQSGRSAVRQELLSQSRSLSTERTYPTRSQSACRMRSGSSTRQQMESRLATTKLSNHLSAIAQTVLSTQNM